MPEVVSVCSGYGNNEGSTRCGSCLGCRMDRMFLAQGQILRDTQASLELAVADLTAILTTQGLNDLNWDSDTYERLSYLATNLAGRRRAMLTAYENGMSEVMGQRQQPVPRVPFIPQWGQAASATSAITAAMTAAAASRPEATFNEWSIDDRNDDDWIVAEETEETGLDLVRAVQPPLVQPEGSPILPGEEE